MENKPTFEGTIRSIPNINSAQVDLVLLKFKPMRYAKNQFIGRKDETCRFTAHIKKGCVSNYRILDNGKKSINHFAFEDWWVGDLESFLNQKPSETYWLTIEDTDLLAINKVDFDIVMNTIPPYRVFFQKKMQTAFLKEMENGDKNKFETALEKYLRMMTNYPQIILRVPHYDIAAYLGIAPESLSRVRNQTMKSDS